MPTLERFATREVGPKDWGVELLVAHTEHYTGKILHMWAGASGPLQYHEHKDETFHLVSGLAEVDFDPGNGLITRRMRPGESYHVPPGAVHRVRAIEDCTFFEASTPAFDDRVNVEHLY